MPEDIAASVDATPSDQGSSPGLPASAQPVTDAPQTATPTPSVDHTAAAPTGSLTADTRSNQTTQTQGASQPAATNGALNGGRPATAPQQSATPPANPEERVRQLEQLIGRQGNELGQWRERVRAYEGLPDPNQLRELIARQQQMADQAKLKPYHPGHPDFHRTEARLNKVGDYMAAAKAIAASPYLDPQQKAEESRRVASEMGVNHEDAALYREHEDNVREASVRLSRDPDRYIGEVVDPRIDARINAKFAEYEQFLQAKTSSEAFLQSNKEALDKHRETALWAMTNPQRRDVAVKLVQALDEVEKLRRQVGQNSEAVEAAAAQNAVLKRRSTVKRDGATSPADDPAQTAISQGLRGNAAFEFLWNRRNS